MWQPRVDILLRELMDAPSVLRLSYVADVEDESLVNRRLGKLKQDIMDAWVELEGDYELVVESEIFWRLGGPPKQSKEASE
jgi:hypothetical protein